MFVDPRHYLTSNSSPGFPILAEELREEESMGTPSFSGVVGDIISKVRKECAKFHRSPHLNDALTSITAGSEGRLKLVLDVRCRWNSTLRMLKNFLSNEESLRSFYEESIPAKVGVFPLTCAEIAHVKEIVAALEPVELCVKRLSQEDMTLRNADLALQVSFSLLIMSFSMT